MKIIFLDIDGVLNSRPFLLQSTNKLRIDRAAVERLDKIVRETGAVIVVSSSWRYFSTSVEIEHMLRDHGCDCVVIDSTPTDTFTETKRGEQIQCWLDDCVNRAEIESFVILDDDDDMDHLSHRLVKTTFDHGLLDQHVDAAIKMLQC